MNNWTSLSLKGCWEVTVPPLQYLSGCRRKKNATQVRSMIAIFLAVIPWEAVSKSWMTLTGRGPIFVQISQQNTHIQAYIRTQKPTRIYKKN